MHSLKNQWSMTSGCKSLGITKLQFVAKSHFFCVSSEIINELFVDILTHDHFIFILKIKISRKSKYFYQLNESKLSTTLDFDNDNILKFSSST